MEIRISDTASEYLKNELRSKGLDKSLRVFVSGLGWGGPIFGIALDEQRDNDNIYNVNGVNILFDKETSEYTKGFEIDYKKSVFGNRVIINEIEGRGGSC